MIREPRERNCRETRKDHHGRTLQQAQLKVRQGQRLADWLRQRGVGEVHVAGIATDYCVRATAADSAAQGFTTRVLLGLTAGVAPGTTAEAITALGDAGVEVVRA